MRRSLLAIGLLLSSHIVSLPARAVDCKVSFDQRCLSHPYDHTKVEQNHAAREQQMNAALKEEYEQAAKAWAAIREAEAQTAQA